MIIGLGLDAVEIERFANYATYAPRKLARIFTDHEIAYCLKNPSKSAERFAARFAAKEALYKALTQAYDKPPCPFLMLCRGSGIVCSPAPSLVIDWYHLDLKPIKSLITLTHTKKLALAHVVLMDNI